MQIHNPAKRLLGRVRTGGTTLVELMVAIVLLTVVSISLVGVMGNIGKQIQGSKSRTLATNLAQEQVQILKEQTFNRVLVTTSPAYLASFSPSIPYDNGYYPPESIIEGGLQFTRYTFIEVAAENSGSLVYLGAVPDTGMKAVTVSVVWKQGADTKKVQVRNILGNINTAMASAIVKGKVSLSTSAATGIQGALVTMAENVGFQDFTDSNGNFLINLLPGTYTMSVTARGFFPTYLVVSVAPNGTLVQNFPLVAMGSGTVQGTAWINNHLLISQIVGSTMNASGFCQEFVEVLNPTTAPVTINGNVQLGYQRYGQSNPTAISMIYNTNAVAPGSYYLFANTSPVTMNGVTRAADAVFTNLNAGYPDLIWVAGPSACGSEGSKGDADGLGIADWGLNQCIDCVGWTTSSHTPPIFKGLPYVQGIGLQDGEQFVRKSSTAGLVVGIARAYNTDNNAVDWSGTMPATLAFKNSSVTEPVVAGFPAYGAYVTATDGLSQVTTAMSVGSPPAAQFQLTSVATGTWTVYVSSGGAFVDISSVTVAPSATTMVPNAVTAPLWPVSGYNSVLLSSNATEGYVAGWVKNTFGLAINPAITVSANSLTAIANTTNGNYLLSVPPGSYDIMANATNPNSLYVSQSSQTVNVVLGEVSSGVNFTLSQGGKIRGFATRDGINALPGIVFIANDASSATKDQEVSGNDGRFLLMNLSTGVYTVYPTLDSGETATPSSTTVTVTAGAIVSAATFTITGAFGSVRGAVTDAGVPIKTGVVIVCSTMTLAAGPPALNFNSLTGGSIYVTNSYEDGTYNLDVRGSTTTTYRLYAYYPKFTGTNAVVSTRTVSAVTVTAGLSTAGVNFGF